ncbi:MAG: hypothetical protein K2H17_02620, partial [Duncaniella sp.]|uniref:hypothetical protein n=1 Tax=Duncaniella sp. TaxID=2518496 RepID=UPI0023D47A05
KVTLKILRHEIIDRKKQQYRRLRKFWAPMALHLSHIARYAPSIQIHIHLKTFAQILTIVFKQPLREDLDFHLAESPDPLCQTVAKRQL